MNQRPRVLIYRDFLLPGSETFIRNQAEGLTRFVPYYAGLTTVDGIALPPERTITAAQGVLGRWQGAAFTRLGVAPQFVWDVWKLQPQLVHAHFGVDATRVMTLSRLLRLPLLVTLHDYDITTSDADLKRRAPYCHRYIARRPRLIREANAFLAVSEFIKQKAIARGFPATKILVHYIGIDTAQFAPTPSSAREPLVLFVGRLVPKKGCEYLIRAMAEIQATRPDVELVIIGAGPLREKLEAQAAATLKRYRFVGAQSSAEVRQWYSRAQVFCAPSVTADTGETEGLPITVLEAQAMALPVISTIHSGIPEAVTHGETGLLAPEHDVGALREHLLDALQNRERALELGANARKQILSRFNMKRQIEILETIYDQLVSRSSGVPKL
jgi:colanic acid/amylovoran biosynthesis glycosyltransferase